MNTPPAPTRASGPSAAALLLVGIVLGGVVGGATATVITGRAPSELVEVTPAPASIPTASAVVVPAGSDTTVDVVRELLPAVVTVVHRSPTRTRRRWARTSSPSAARSASSRTP